MPVGSLVFILVWELEKEICNEMFCVQEYQCG